MQLTNHALTVLQIASFSSEWGGGELHLLNLSNQLVRRGHHVTIACRPNGWVFNKATELGIPTLSATVLRQTDWSQFPVFREWCKKNSCDVIHTHSLRDAYVSASAAKTAGVPVRVMTRHSPFPFEAFDRWVYTNLLYNRILAVSHSVANTLIQHGVRKAKVAVVHHGTDAGEFQKTTLPVATVRKELGLADNEVAVGIVGRIVQEKGHRFLFEAIGRLSPNLPVRVVVVGDGPEGELIRRYVHDHDLDRRVNFMPFRSDVNNVFNALDIVVVPSTYQEPCSAVVQQAMALSRPVIGTRTGGTPEMILDGETGLLVPPSDSESLARSIETLARDGDLRRQMGVAGRARVEQHFSLNVMTDKVVDIYRHEFEAAGSLRRQIR